MKNFERGYASFTITAIVRIGLLLLLVQKASTCVNSCTTAKTVAEWTACYCCPGEYRQTVNNGRGQFLYAGCSLCEAGTYKDKNNHMDANCDTCPVGKYTAFSAKGTVTCTDCLAGKYDINQLDEYSRYLNQDGSMPAGLCTDCVKGKSQSQTGKTVCNVCLAGTYSSDAGSVNCLNCDAGKIAQNQGATTCTNCDLGKFSGDRTICTLCVPGKFARETLISYCDSCPAGKIQPNHGQSVCQDCEKGKFQSSQGMIVCQECTTGKYKQTSGINTECQDCEKGKFVSYTGATVCTNCVLNQFQDETGTSICKLCGTGKYSSAGASMCSFCQNGQYINPDYIRTETIPCILCGSCNPGSIRAGCLASGESPGLCKNCGAGKLLNVISATCDPCPVGTFQEAINHTLVTCKKCPHNSNSYSGSTDCTCNPGWAPYFKQGERICGCEQGSYVKNLTMCEKCKTCDTETVKNRQYRSGCGYDREGICVDCNASCPEGQTLAGCGGFSAGECKPTSYLVPTPQCPVDDPFRARATGFGRWDFTSVFRTDENSVDFRCSDVCDGTLNYDSQQCDGPYACNMRTCAASVQEVDGVIPVRVCPVVITLEDQQQSYIVDLKRRAKCVTCQECGRVGYDEGIKMHADWGVGCARECSQLMCTDGKIWDWTVQGCRQCGNLRDMRLCSSRDVEKYNLEASKVTGNWPLLLFEGCQGSGTALLTDIGVGRCSTCEKRDTCGAAHEYPTSCIDATNVRCEMCSRARESVYFALLKGRWLNLNSGTGVLEDLHCQISACKTREGDQWTGVHRDGTLCHRKCVSVVPDCTADQVLVPCRLPHQARCEPGFPSPADALPTMQLYRNLAGQVYAGAEVNLLNEANEMSSRRFASFENILIVLDSLNEYQCVWNADGIVDNIATPAGISHAFWAALETNDERYEARGTRACRSWEIAEHVTMPLLPLQNTVSCSEEENATSHCLERMVLVNTEAYAVSYRFHGQWNVFGMDPILANWEPMLWQSTEHMRQRADVGGAGLLYLMLRMHQRHVKLAVDVPRDRALHRAPWLRAVLTSFAVVDVTEYPKAQTHANVRVRPNLTVDGEAISDVHDLFVPESFWAQPLSVQPLSAQPLSAQPHSLQNESSLFQVLTDPWFSNWTSCGSNAKPSESSFVIAPSLEAPTNGHGWARQENDSALMYELSTSCVSDVSGEVWTCDDLVPAADVFVLRRPYEYRPAKSFANCSGPAWACEATTDKALLGLRHLYTHLHSAPVADRHKAGAAEKLVYQLSIPALSLANIQQMHTGDPYSRCPMLATSVNRIECIGTDNLHSLHQIEEGSGLRFMAGFHSVVGGRSVLIVMLAKFAPFSSVLYWQDQDASAKTVISSASTNASDTGLSNVWYNDTVSGWISVASVGNSVMALCLTDTNAKILAVRSYELYWTTVGAADEVLAMRNYESELTLPGEWLIDVEQEDRWLRFCNLVAPRQASHFLAACVLVTSEQSTMLSLRVCVGPRNVFETSNATCNDTALDLPVSESPSFVSAAFLRQASQLTSTPTSLLWAVGVKGTTFSVVYSESTVEKPQLILQHVPTSDLERKHFVQTGHLFFTFQVTGIFPPEVLAYLPDFERLKLEQKVLVSTAYAVLVVPRVEQATTTDSFYIDDDQKLQSAKAKLSLSLRRASYIVHKRGEPALPVYERTADAVVGNRTTELHMSVHKVSLGPAGPSSFLARYSQATPGSPDAQSGALNRALGLPFALGRYEQRDEQCVFTEWQHGQLVRRSPPPPPPPPPPTTPSPTTPPPTPPPVYRCPGDNPTVTPQTRTCPRCYCTAMDTCYLGGSWVNCECCTGQFCRSSTNKYLYTSYTCYECPKNTYRDTQISRHINQCLACPAGCQTAGTGANSIQECKSPPPPPPPTTPPPVYTCPGDSGLINNTRQYATSSCNTPGTDNANCQCHTGWYGTYYKPADSNFEKRICGACEKGTYQDEVGFILNCKPCPNNCTTPSKGANSRSVCVSPPQPTPTPSPTTPAPTTPAPTTPPPAGDAVDPDKGLVLGFNASRWGRLRGAEPWLLLQFTVPCGARLRAYKRGGATCGLADAAGLQRSAQLEPECPPHEHVVVLLDATLATQTTVYYLRLDGSIARLTLERCDCIFMGAGVFWVDGAAFPWKPPEYEVRVRLLRPVQAPDTAAQHVLPDNVHRWRRERHVLALMPRQHMRLELHFERDMTANSDLQVSVGVDDVQLAPVLSSFPVFREAGSRWCTRVHVPSAQQLADIGLRSLFLGNHSILNDDWERIQGTVSLDVRSQSVLGCGYSAVLFSMRSSCRDEAGAQSGRLDNLGCKLELALGGMGVYDECQLELPAYIFTSEYDEVGLGIALAPLDENLTCAPPHESSFFVSLRPHTKLYSCPLGEFLHKDGACRNCHEYGGHDLCDPGFRLRGCPALERADRQNCVPCDEGRELVDEERTAAYVPVSNSTVPCQWRCLEGFYLMELLGVRRCVLCDEARACKPGERWQGCSFDQNAGCVPCEELWLTKGPYADNEEYFNHNDTCQTRCKAGHYRDRMDVCKECWSTADLILREGPGFYTFRECTNATNTQIRRCAEEEGSDIVGHDPGFTGDCQRACKRGWRRAGGTCTKCDDPPLFVDGELDAAQFLPAEAFEWVADSPDCAFECRPPYTDAPLPSSDNRTAHTCVRCDVCEVGQYPSGTFCQCSTCVM